jgi:hypothetical protein
MKYNTAQSVITDDDGVVLLKVYDHATALNIMRFKPDVAYMPVPRCDKCKHWYVRPEYIEPHGACMADFISSDCNDYTIIVSADFGCVKWEAR